MMAMSAPRHLCCISTDLSIIIIWAVWKLDIWAESLSLWLQYIFTCLSGRTNFTWLRWERWPRLITALESPAWTSCTVYLTGSRLWASISAFKRFNKIDEMPTDLHTGLVSLPQGTRFLRKGWQCRQRQCCHCGPVEKGKKSSKMLKKILSMATVLATAWIAEHQHPPFVLFQDQPLRERALGP